MPPTITPRTISQTGAALRPMLAQPYDNTEPKGWWMSEKLDGVRAIWTGSELISRSGLRFHAPESFTAGLPRGVVLDGELWEGRGEFQRTVGKVRRHVGDWTGVRFMVFDLVGEGSFETRFAALQRLGLPGHAELVAQRQCQGADDLMRFEAEILTAGGEGVMLREPGSRYEQRRSPALLKVKRMSSAEARVIGHEAGTGRNVDRTGALICEYAGKTFRVGAGLTDDEREAPPEIGAEITFSYFGLTDGGIPRHPSFVAVRDYE